MNNSLLQRSLDPFSLAFSSESGYNAPSIFTTSNHCQPYQRLICYDSLNAQYDINRIKFEREFKIDEIDTLLRKSSKNAQSTIVNDLKINLNNHLNIVSYYLQNQFKVFPKRCHYAAVNCLDLDQIDHEYLLSGSNDGKIKIWNVKDRDADNSETPNRNQVTEIGEISPQFADRGDRRTTSLLNQDTANRTVHGHNYGISQVKWWPFDTGMFVSSSFDKTIKLWDPETLKLLYTFDNEKMMPKVVPDQYSLPSSTPKTAPAYTNNNNAIHQSHDNAFGQIYAIDFSPTLQHGLLGIASQGTNFIKLLDINSLTLTNYLFGHTNDSITSVKWNPAHPNILATGGNAGELKVWDIRRGDSCIYTLSMLENSGWENTSSHSYAKAHTRAINGLCWTLDGTGLISVGLDNCVKWWDLQESKLTNIVGNRIVTKNALFNQSKRRKKTQTRSKTVTRTNSGTKMVTFADVDNNNDQDTDFDNPTIENNFLQSVNPIVTAQRNSNAQHLFYPSKKISIFNLYDNGAPNSSEKQHNKTEKQQDKNNSKKSNKGRLLRTLRHTDLGSHHYDGDDGGNSNDPPDKQRFCCIIYGGSSSNLYYTGTSDGLIYTWGPRYNVLDDDFNEDEEDEEGEKRGEYFKGIYIAKA